MIGRRGNAGLGYTYIPICDGCGAELPEEWDFYDAVNAMKAQGWRIEPPSETDGDWCHYCPACAAAWDFGEV